MKMRVSFTLALRFLGIGSGKSVSNARRSLYGAILGIGISLVPLVTVLVVADGMIEGISSRFIELSSAHIRVTDYTGLSGINGDRDTLVSLAEDIVANDLTGRVLSAQPERQGLSLAIGSRGRSGATVRSVLPSYFSPGSGPASLFSVSEGTLSLDTPDGALVGKKLAEDIGLHSGDTFRILTMKQNADGKTIPRFSTFRVSGIISSGYQELDALWVYIPLEKGFTALAGSSASTFINVRTDNPREGLEAVKYSLMRTLPDGMSVYTWKQLNRSQFQAFNTTRTLLLFIMLLIVFIALVNVSSALVMLVMERRQEIAILKSTGASPEGITFAFIISGFLAGLGGVLVGLPAGICCAVHINGIFAFIEKILNGGSHLAAIVAGIAQNSDIIANEIHLLDPAFYLETIPVHLYPGELFLIASGTLCVSILVSVIPAIRAGREKPLDTIRKF